MKLLRPVQKPYRFIQWFWANPQMYKKYWRKGHSWLDYAWPKAWIPQGVFCSQKGMVSFIWEDKNRWKYVIVRHTDDWLFHETIYAHLSTIECLLWQYLLAWDKIGMSGATGNVQWVHLHFWLRPINYNKNNGYEWWIDPAPYIVDSLVDFDYGKEIETARKYLVDNGIYDWKWSISEDRLIIMLSRILLKQHIR